MATSRRQTQTIGGTQGSAFAAPPGDNDISRLSFYTNCERLKGIKVAYADGNVQRIGNAYGNSFRELDVASDPIRTIVVYTDENSSVVLGVQIGQQSRTVSLFGSETDYSRSASFPLENRLIGISGRHQDDCVVAIKFIYVASSNAFEPPAHAPNRDDRHGTRNVDPGENPSQTQSTWSQYFDFESAASLAASAVAIGATGYAVYKTMSALRNMTKPSGSASSSSDDDDDRCRNFY